MSREPTFTSSITGDAVTVIPSSFSVCGDEGVMAGDCGGNGMAPVETFGDEGVTAGDDGGNGMAPIATFAKRSNGLLTEAASNISEP